MTFERGGPPDQPPYDPDQPIAFRIRDVPGSYIDRDQVVAIGEARDWDGKKVGAWVPASREVLDDIPNLGAYMIDRLQKALRRQMCPWEGPDLPAIRWTFDPFPGVTRARARVTTAYRRTWGRVFRPLVRVTGWVARRADVYFEPDADDTYD